MSPLCVFILPTNELRHFSRKMQPQAYQTSQYVVPPSGILLGTWRNTLTGSSDGSISLSSKHPIGIVRFSK
jgi:hypothetical protein